MADASHKAVLVVVEAPPHVSEHRYEVLKSLSGFIPTAYRPKPQPPFVFLPHTPAPSEPRDLMYAVTATFEEAQRARKKQSAALCAYAAVGTANDLGMGIIVVVDEVGPLRVNILGPYMYNLSHSEGASIQQSIKEILKHEPSRSCPFDVRELGEKIEWAIDAILDSTSTRN